VSVTPPTAETIGHVPDYPSLTRLDGRGFVLMGSGRGLGRQCAHALASAGARLVCADVDPAAAETTAAEVDAIPFAGDLTQRASVEQLFATAQAEFGKVDGFVDLIGKAVPSAVADLDDASWDRQLDIVLRHAQHAATVGGSLMAASGGGVMVFVSSVAADRPAPGLPGYSAAKAAVVALAKSVTLELGPSGVRANTVAPGMMWTPALHEQLGPDAWAANAAIVPQGRVATPADVAGVVLFLASDLSSHVCGQTLLVDGGAYLVKPYPAMPSLDQIAARA
jgi:NAD(P)-dependent dehydrogenase (short-subunit alcohol dehydrogenase family)